MGRKNVLRFNVGGNEDRSSEVWRLWARGDDIYFFKRSVTDKVHISLHKSGVWKMDMGKDRFVLNKEISITQSWGLGPALLFPNLNVKRFNVEGKHLDDSKIVVLSNAPENMQRVICLLFQRDTNSSSIQDISKKLVKEEIDWHYQINLKSMGLLHLISFIDNPSKQSLEEYYSIKNKFKFNFKDKIPDKGIRLNGIVLDSPQDKRCQSLIYTIPLDIDNCQIE